MPISGDLLKCAAALVFVGLVIGLQPPAAAQRCSSFRSCEEAMRSLRGGNRQIDGDGDGIPCERQLCGGSRGGQPSGGSAGPFVSPTFNVAPRSTPAARPRQSLPDRPLASGPASLISVGDGDTIRVATTRGEKVTIRLACIDAPETAQGESGAQATAALRQLLAGDVVDIRPQTADRYGRTMAEVYSSGRNVNLELVKSGAAYVYRQYLAGCDQGAYLGAEQEAEMWRRGVWRSGTNEQRPWDFRKSR